MPTVRYLQHKPNPTQEQLVAVADVSTSTAYYIEAGRVTPRPVIGRRLVRVLKAEPTDLAIIPQDSGVTSAF